MTISFACPHCGRPFKVPDGLAGKRARCKTCSRTITVPEADPEILVLSEKYAVKPEKPVPTPAASAHVEAQAKPSTGPQDGNWLSEAIGESQPLLPTSRGPDSTMYVWLAVGCVGAAMVMFGSLVVFSLVNKRQMRAAAQPVVSSDPDVQSSPDPEPLPADRPTAGQSDSSNDSAASPDLQSGLHTKVPGTRISLIKPEGFSVAQAFSGFQQKDTMSSIVVVEMPAPYREAVGGFSDATKMNQQGMQLILSEEVVVDGQAAKLFQLRQTVQGTAFLKWVVAFGDDSHVVMINAMCPEARKAELAGPLRQASLSVKYDGGQVPDPDEGLPFTLSHQGKLKRAGRITNMLMYTLNGQVPAPTPESPIFVAAKSISNVLKADAKTLAEERLLQTATIDRIRIETGTLITIDGLQGYEIEATAEHRQSGVPLAVYQVMLFDDGDYILMQGMVGSSDKAEFLPEFKSLARSLNRTDP